VTRQRGWPPPEIVQSFRIEDPTYLTRRSHRVDGCLIWDGAVTTNGYGHMRLAGYDVRVHRLALELATEPRSSRYHALHTCDNRRCIESSHLYWGDAAQNMADMAARGRSVRGEASPHARLTDSDVRAIRAAAGTLNQRELAHRFGVSPSLISRVLGGDRWAHVS
jgi:hypothetical protein